MVRETLRTGGKILTDITENNSPEVNPKDFVSKHVNKFVQNLISNLRGRGRKQIKGGGKLKSVKKAKKARIINRDMS